MKGTSSSRIASVDILRGIVMIIMVLDHTRDFFTNYQPDPTDLTHPNGAYFMTRWIAHLCAPTFVFLSGSSAFLSMQKGKSKRQTAWGLVTRGLWLIILELTIIRFGWEFNWLYDTIWLQVIWVIGLGMILLAGLIFLPVPVTLLISLVIIFGHNFFDGLIPTGNTLIWWNILHQPGGIQLSAGHQLLVLYPLIPWIAVLWAGYCFGSILMQPQVKRDWWCSIIGWSAIGLFILIRSVNIYGDPLPWQHYGKGWVTLLSFINCQKYPPSLLYLLMTLGPAIASMPWLEKMRGGTASFFTVYGRVPLFYYVLHVYVLHTVAFILGMIQGMPEGYFTHSSTEFTASHGWGYPLPVVYAIWISVVLSLYYPCRWFMRLKMRSGRWWMSYI